MMMCLQSWGGVATTPISSKQGSVVDPAWMDGRRRRMIRCSNRVEQMAVEEEEGKRQEEGRRGVVIKGLAGIGILAASPLISPIINPLTATAAAADQGGGGGRYESFVDVVDGYSYVYPSDWREFEFRGHDSAFKDRYLQLQNVRVRFLPTEKQDVHEIGPLDKVVPELVKNIYAAPNQLAYIYDMQEKNVNGKNYYTFEYMLRSPIYGSSAFTTIAVANGRFYTLTVGANDRRWRKVRNQLKVVADSFQLLDI